MPQGKGTYGSKVGRPAKKKAGSALSGLFSKAKRKMGPQMSERELFSFVSKKMKKKFGPQVTTGEISRIVQQMRKGR